MTKEELILKEDYDYDEIKGIWSKHYKRFLNGYVRKDGYVEVLLKCIDGRQRIFLYHRVMWFLAYGPIPEGMQVNHIREFEKTDNRLCNLELVTPKENINYGTRNERAATSKSKPVVAVDMDNNVVMEFSSAKEAGCHGFCNVAVNACCNNCYNRQGNRFFKGYFWYFKDEYEKLMWEEVMIGET